jgi:hypothetical protein
MATVTDFGSPHWDAVRKATELGLLPWDVTEDEHIRHGRLMDELIKFILERERNDQARRDAVSLPKSLGRRVDALSLATLFHETYERLAPSFGYVTRPETREFNATSDNGKLMVATCEAVLDILKE